MAIIIGIIGSIIAMIATEILNKLEIDDVVGAIPVHLAAGVWGTLAVRLRSTWNRLSYSINWNCINRFIFIYYFIYNIKNFKLFLSFKAKTGNHS